MRVMAVFEEWLLGDGVYPLLERGQVINVAFSMDSDTLTEADGAAVDHFTHRGGALCDFCGRVIWTKNEGDVPVMAIEASGFRFYCASDQFTPQTRLVGSGLLCIDYGFWSERIASLPDAPNLFCPMKIARIQQVTIPESFITRLDNGASHPAALSPCDYSVADVVEIVAMNDYSNDEIFFLLECDNADLELAQLPRTFIE